EVIHTHHGQVNETAGDGLMIIFEDGDPEVHARNAVRAALEILDVTDEVNEEALRKDRGAASDISADLHIVDPIKVNIGINSGKAWVGLTKFEGLSGIRYTYTATGPVTNVAARIGAMAADGDILISEETARRVQAEVPLESLGPQAFKNVSRRIEVFRPVSVQARRADAGLGTELSA